MPEVSHLDHIASKFILHEHTIGLWSSYAIHCSKKATLMRLHRGNLGVILEKAETLVTDYIGNCAR